MDNAEGGFLAAFSDVVARDPDRVAIVDDTLASLTYGELDRLSNQLCRHLSEGGIEQHEVVVVCMERNVRLLVALLAALKAGCAYLPIDPGYPRHRVETMIVDSGARIAITDSSSAVTGVLGDLSCTVLDDEWPLVVRQSAEPVYSSVPGGALAYLIYTSGSAGQPKGVMVSRDSLTVFLRSMVDRPGLGPDDRVAALTTTSFDISALELFLPLIVGARVVLGSLEATRDPDLARQLIERHDVSVVQATPSKLRLLLDAGWVPGRSVRVFSGGEKLAPDLARSLTRTAGEVWDLYGPTEATVWCASADLDDAGQASPWRPTLETCLHVLDRDLKPVRDAEIGELYVSGRCLARGYRHRAAETASRFIPNPFSDEPGTRLYRTGDLVRAVGGSFEIVGRADDQLKVHGFRIEPGEIEAILEEHPTVQAAVVTVGPTGSLVAFIICHHAGDNATRAVREFAASRLPSYMVPNQVVITTAFPQTQAGKIDRRSLADLLVRHGTTAAPQDDQLMADVAAIWCEVLGHDTIAPDTDFFELGGHSLLASMIAIRVRSRLKRDVPIHTVFEHPTIAEMSAACADSPQLQ